MKKKEKRNLEVKLKRAYELRDFEISHYWKRAQYFWGFLAVIYASYFVFATNQTLLQNEFSLIICSTGTIFSFAWYLVNRGSKRWQEHWENIITKLETTLERPLYEYKPDVESNFFNAGNFSVSRINIVVSFLIFISWIGLWFFSLKKPLDCFDTEYIIGGLTILSLVLIYFLGKGKNVN